MGRRRRDRARPVVLGHNGAVVVRRFRLRMSPVARALRAGVLGVIGVLFVPQLLTPGADAGWRLVALAGVASSVYGLRIVLGPAVVVRPEGLVLLHRWPRRREIPWYRFLEVDVVPGAWMLEVELNSGERLVLPAVEHVDVLYEAIEEHRHLLDA